MIPVSDHVIVYHVLDVRWGWRKRGSLGQIMILVCPLTGIAILVSLVRLVRKMFSKPPA